MEIRDRRWRSLWREHGIPLLLYALLTLAITWPAARDFFSRLVSNGGDARNNLWMLWHVKEVVQGNHHLFDMPLLYYPAGVNLLSRGLGPVVGILALPFWPLGPEAAYNGSLLVGFWLTGYFMYLLGRGLGFERRVAFFGGLALLVAPIHLAGIAGHMTKTFLGLIPLAMLTLHHALNPRRSPWWALAVAAVVFLLLFHNLYQLIFTGLAFVFMAVVRLFVDGRPQTADGGAATEPETSPVHPFTRSPLQRLVTGPLESAVRRLPSAVLKRGLLTIAAILILVGPFTLMFFEVAQDPNISVDANLQSVAFQPDVTELFMPPRFSLLWGRLTAEFQEQNDIEPSIETNVYLSWTVLVLCVLAWRKGSRCARAWLLFAALIALLALGPSLKWMGERAFTEYELPILLPYALLTGLPGFDFMRAPGRFMMLGSVIFAVSAAFGLAWLLRRYPARAWLITLAVVVLLLIELWPRPWLQETLHPVPQFYLQIAQDDDLYGVFDLPVKPDEDTWFAGYASYFQRYQMEHHKGIASGYLARTYTVHPLFPCVIPEFREPLPDILLNGEPADCAANVLHDLAYFNYRYVVYHKPVLKETDEGDAWGREQARQFLSRYFDGATPLVDDDLTTVYAVPPLTEAARGLQPTIGLLENWYRLENDDDDSWRWAQSPATLFLSVPQAQTVTLALTPGPMFDPDPRQDQVVGLHGQLGVALNGEPVDTLQVAADETATVTLDLPAGIHTVSLSLQAGNFSPADYEDMGDDRRQISFTLREIELITDN